MTHFLLVDDSRIPCVCELESDHSDAVFYAKPFSEVALKELRDSYAVDVEAAFLTAEEAGKNLSDGAKALFEASDAHEVTTTTLTAEEAESFRLGESEIEEILDPFAATAKVVDSFEGAEHYQTPTTTTCTMDDARHMALATESVDLICTSPPYFALRSYKDEGEHMAGQLGDEQSVDEYIGSLMECMEEFGRVLKPEGSIWINLGDKYSRGYRKVADVLHSFGDERHSRGGLDQDRRDDGAKPKSLIGVPWRFAIRCIDDGWILRAEVIWNKPNAIPDPTNDRVRRSHEHWFHFVKQGDYFANLDPIREPYSETGLADTGGRKIQNNKGQPDGGTPYTGKLTGDHKNRSDLYEDGGRIPSSVWEVSTEALRVPDHLNVEHFASYPQELPRRIILGWAPEGGVVLDPFGGTGTTAGVAQQLGRIGISNDLSRSYTNLAEWRIFESDQFIKSHEKWLAEQELGVPTPLERYLMSFTKVGRQTAASIVDAVGNPFSLSEDITKAFGVGDRIVGIINSELGRADDRAEDAHGAPSGDLQDEGEIDSDPPRQDQVHEAAVESSAVDGRVVGSSEVSQSNATDEGSEHQSRVSDGVGLDAS